ncbi:protein of unknown function [Cupriavidus taiwanensis]|nr:protein of unknown function [Cupriavidus taiwanensis]
MLKAFELRAVFCDEIAHISGSSPKMENAVRHL